MRCSESSTVGQDVIDRFWPKVSVAGDDECWNWNGAKNKGYGFLSSQRGKAPYKAHRISYLIHKGALNDGMVIRHKCDNPSCVNPNHLEQGTQKQNANDMVCRGRMNKASFKNLQGNHVKALNADGLRQCLELRANGFSYKAIGEKLGINSSTVGLYIRGKRQP